MNNLEVSIVKYLCPICGKVAEEGIIMNSLLTEKNAKAVKDLHNKTIGYTDHACSECKQYSKDAIFFIGIDEEKSTKEEPYRTGQIVGVKPTSSLVKHCKDYIHILKDGSKFCYISKNVGKSIGLW